MSRLRQRIRFCNSRDGVRLAYATVGQGPPLVLVSGGHSHLELDLGSPVFGHWIAELARTHALVRLDTRGYGLSERDVADHSIEAIAADLAAVADALELSRFALVAWMGATPIALTYAHANPGRVSHLVLHGGYLRGWLMRGVDSRERAAVEALVAQVHNGWDLPDPIVRHAITSSFIPESTAEQQAWMNEALRLSAHGADAARRFRVRLLADVTAIAREVRAATLVLNTESDTNPPLSESLLAASRIPDAHLVALPGRNHILLEDEPAWPRWLEEVRSFLEGDRARGSPFEGLSPRELELARLIAAGLDNAQVAARLDISEKTVRNHVTRVFAKLGVTSRAQAIVLAHRAGLGESVPR
jgi:DNA-binding CsgD family transcriptional regulator/pimeloyl-ACP methyl ester carboxylesterase